MNYELPTAQVEIFGVTKYSFSCKICEYQIMQYNRSLLNLLTIWPPNIPKCVNIIWSHCIE